MNLERICSQQHHIFSEWGSSLTRACHLQQIHCGHGPKPWIKIIKNSMLCRTLHFGISVHIYCSSAFGVGFKEISAVKWQKIHVQTGLQSKWTKEISTRREGVCCTSEVNIVKISNTIIFPFSLVSLFCLCKEHAEDKQIPLVYHCHFSI